jgi:hypothetical protein
MRLVFLDAGPLGLISNARGKPRADRCRRWATDVQAGGSRIFVPEIADYEVRRKLLHAGATAGILRLDPVVAASSYAALTTAAMHRAAELWAMARAAGPPTAPPEALGGDCILAAQATSATSAGSCRPSPGAR